MIQGEDNHWQIGLHYNNIVDGQLAQQGGYKSAHDFFVHEFKDQGQSTLSVYGAVAKSFSEDTAKAYTCTRLGLLLQLARARHLTLPTGDPGDLSLGIPAKDGTSQDKKFRDCSSGDLKHAIQTTIQGGTGLPATAAQKLAARQAALQAALGDHAHVRLEAHLKGSEVVWSISDVPDVLFNAALDAIKGA